MTEAKPDLYRILYRSRCALTGSDASIDEQVEEIVASSQTNNARDGLTGALVLASGLFVQVIEGPGAVLEAAFERICCDLRHTELQLIEFTQVDTRLFEEWDMDRVRADTPIEALFTGFDSARAGDPGVSDAAAQAMTLMAALVRVSADEAGPRFRRRSAA